MPAHEKVSVQEISNSLRRWRGNLQAVASELGLNRGALYERIQRIGIDLAGFRASGTVAGTAAGPVDGIKGVKGVKVRSGARVCIAVQDRLREAKWDLQALYRRELDETAVLEAFMQEALAASHGNISTAAEALGMARNNLYKRIVALGLDLVALRGSAPPRKRRLPGPRVLTSPAGRIRQPCTVYLRPEQFKALTEASFDLAPILRERLSASTVLERYIDDGFAGWLRTKLGQP